MVIKVFVLGLEVRDLDRLFEVLKERGFSIEEGMHTVLLDSSELGVWYCLREGRRVAAIVAHYIDAHYEAIASLPPDASDKELLKALIEAERRGLWRAPVEPVVVVSADEELASLAREYADSYPERAIEMLQHYQQHAEDREVVKNFLERLAPVFRELAL